MKKTVIGLAALAIMCTTGCAEVVDLTENESKIIAQYAVTTTLKYDKKYDKNIVKVSQVEEVEEENLDNQTEQTHEIQENDNLEDISVSEKEEEGVKKPNIAGALNIENAVIDYIGSEIMYQYKTEDAITVPAAGESQLLVLKFNLINSLNENNFVEILSTSPKFTIDVNGKTVKALETFIVNDMTTLCDELEPNEVQEQVLIFELSDEDVTMLDKITLNIVSGDNSTTLDLE